jgi:shikimate dehydrogenase
MDDRQPTPTGEIIAGSFHPKRKKKDEKTRFYDVFFDAPEHFLNNIPEKPFLLLLGDPVHHSLSPAMHNAALHDAGRDWEYHALRISTTQLPQLQSIFALPGFRGANVTVPHKVDILPFCDVLDETAREIGAVNTIVPDAGKRTGFNTDLPGFLDGLQRAGVSKVSKVAVLGTGGTSRMVVSAFKRQQPEPEIRVFSRQPSGNSFDYATLPAFLQTADVLVNCTPKGMWPNVDETPVDLAALPFSLKHLTVYDLIYRPLQTRLLYDAAAKNARTISGLEMFIGQGARAFSMWTGLPFGYEAARERLLKILS